MHGQNNMILVIFGAGGLGKEVAELASIVNEKHHRWDEVVFNDDVIEEGRIIGIRTLRTKSIEASFDIKEIEYVIALGEPKSKEAVYHRLKDRGYSFANIIAPDAQISDYSTLGEGVIIKKGSIVQAEAELGNNVTLQSYVAIGHGAKIGAHCQISTFSVVGGETIVGDGTYISMNCSIRDKISLGSDVIVSAGSAVLRDVESSVTVAGNPARIVLKNTEETKVFR